MRRMGRGRGGTRGADKEVRGGKVPSLGSAVAPRWTSRPLCKSVVTTILEERFDTSKFCIIHFKSLIGSLQSDFKSLSLNLSLDRLCGPIADIFVCVGSLSLGSVQSYWHFSPDRLYLVHIHFSYCDAS